jgi:glutathione S-transferase
MTLTIYGSRDSRTMRVLWAAHELDLAFIHIPYGYDDPALKQPEFLRINPAGQIPAIDDNGFALSESLAIILYLAKRYGRPPLYPSTLTGEALVWRWTLWAQVQLEPWLQGDALLKDVMVAARDRAMPFVEKSLDVLESHLSGKRWILGTDFTAADLTVAAVLSPSRAVKLPLEHLPNIKAWHMRCYSRPAAIKARGAPSYVS